MKGLRWRLLVSLLAATMVGLFVTYAAFLLWGARQLGRERRVEMQAALLEVVEGLGAGREPAVLLDQIARAHDFTLALVRRDGSTLVHGPIALPEPEPAQEGRFVAGGFEHTVAQLHGNPEFVRAIASRQRTDSVARLFSGERTILGLFALAAAVIVVLALFFLRRAVLRPLSHLTSLVSQGDPTALLRFGSGASNDFAQLSRAVIATNQKLEEDRQQIAAQLDALALAQQRLIRAERLAVVGQLAAGIAHEIGNPLTVLSGFVEMLGDPDLSDKDRREALARMAKELSRIQVTVRSLLDYSRAKQSGSERGEIGGALEHVRRLLAPQQRMRGITLEMPALAGPLEVGVSTDALTQLLLNLLLNAADALGNRGKVAVSVHEESPALVVLDVDDSGPGVQEELRASIFEPFFTTKPKGSGTGLGLAVCERIVTSAGGDIGVEVSPLGGARFRVRLPRPKDPNVA